MWTSKWQGILMMTIFLKLMRISFLILINRSHICYTTVIDLDEWINLTKSNNSEELWFIAIHIFFPFYFLSWEVAIFCLHWLSWFDSIVHSLRDGAIITVKGFFFLFIYLFFLLYMASNKMEGLVHTKRCEKRNTTNYYW